MIHHVFIIDAYDDIVVQREWESFEIDMHEVREFAQRVKESQFELFEELGSIKYIGMPLGRGVVILCAEGFDDDDALLGKLREVTEEFRQVISYEVDYEVFMAKLEDYIVLPLKVSILGFGGVGKTTFTTLLSGGTPPTSYIPTMAIDVEHLEGVRIGTYQVVVWDFAGQPQFHKLWRLYLRGTRLVILVTDSSLENVLASKAELIDYIWKMKQPAKVLALANKQDLKGALSPKLVQRILGVKTYGMVAIDGGNRQKGLDIIREGLEDDDDIKGT